MWTDRQHALLKAMGLRLWSPPLPAPGTAAHAVAPAPEAGHDVVGAPAPAPAIKAPRAEVTAPPPVSLQPAPAAAASAAHLSHLDWPALRAAVADCRACSLCDSRRQTVFGAGHVQARWLVVGEAPGEQEDAAGEPFVGPAGQLLDAMLQALHLSRRDGKDKDDDLAAWPAERRVYIANTLKCRPPRNRNPEPAELAQCAPFLARQIELLRPQIILALGRFAVQALLNSAEPIGRLRGRVHRYQGTPVVVSYHPAYLLRNPADKARAWEDLCLAAEAADAAAAAKAPHA